MRRSRSCAFLVVGLVVSAWSCAQAEEYTWTGLASTPAWSVEKNWDPDGKPRDGDSVVLHGAARSVNDTAGIALKSLTIDGKSTLEGLPIRITENFEWSGGFILNTVSLDGLAHGSIAGTGAFPPVVVNGRIANAGTILLTAGTLGLEGDSARIDNSGTFIMFGGTRIFGLACCDLLSRFYNTGTLRVQGPPVGGAEATFDHAGLMNSGTITVVRDNVLQLVGAPQMFEPAASIDGGGRVRVSTLATLTGDIVLDGAIFELGIGGTLTASPRFPGKTRATVHGVGTFAWTGGTITEPFESRLADKFLISGGADKSLVAATFVNSGTAEWHDAGRLLLGSGATFRNDGTLTVFDKAHFSGSARERFLNTKRYVQSPNATVTGDVSPFVNEGDADLAGSTLLLVRGGYQQAKGTTKLSKGRIDARLSHVDVTGGSLVGPGELFGDVRNGALLAPGGDAATYGTVKITGRFLQFPAGTLVIRVGGAIDDAGTKRRNDAIDTRPSVPPVEAPFSAYLDGTIRLTEMPGKPLPHDDALLNAVTYASRCGTFVKIDDKTGVSPAMRVWNDMTHTVISSTANPGPAVRYGLTLPYTPAAATPPPRYLNDDGEVAAALSALDAAARRAKVQSYLDLVTRPWNDAKASGVVADLDRARTAAQNAPLQAMIARLSAGLGDIVKDLPRRLDVSAGPVRDGRKLIESGSVDGVVTDGARAQIAITNVRSVDDVLVRMVAARDVAATTGVKIWDVMALYRTEGDLVVPMTRQAVDDGLASLAPTDGSWRGMAKRGLVWSVDAGVWNPEPDDALLRAALLEWSLHVGGLDLLATHGGKTEAGFAAWSHRNWLAAGYATDTDAQARLRWRTGLQALRLRRDVASVGSSCRTVAAMIDADAPLALVEEPLREAVVFLKRRSTAGSLLALDANDPDFANALTPEMTYLDYHLGLDPDKPEPGISQPPRSTYVMKNVLASALAAARSTTGGNFAALRNEIAKGPAAFRTVLQNYKSAKNMNDDDPSIAFWAVPGRWAAMQQWIKTPAHLQLTTAFIVDATKGEWTTYVVPRRNVARYRILREFYRLMMPA